MMELGRKNIEAMRTAFSVKFNEGIQLASSNYKEFCMIEGSEDNEILEFPFLQSFAFMREWLGDRHIKNVMNQKLRIVERAFEDTIAIPMRSIQTDRYGLYAHMIKAMGEGCESLWDRLAAEAILSPAAWIDGLPFFSEERKYGESTICNIDSGALNAANFEKAYATMQSYEAHNGEPISVTPDLLIVGPENRAAAFEILELERVPNAEGTLSVANRNYKLARIQVNPRIRGKYKNFWFLAATGGSVKPVVIQQSMKGKLSALDQDNDENVFMRSDYIYGTKAYGNAACAFPHLLYRGGTVAE